MIKKLTDICRPKQWKTIPGKELLNEGFPVYGANGIVGYWSDFNHEFETIIIACRGTCGMVNITVPQSYVNGNAMCLDNLSDDVLLEYLYYYLKGYNFTEIISGTTIPQITIEGLKKVEVLIPPKEKQQEIVDVFARIERSIEGRKKELQILDDLIKAKFIELFGDVIHNDKGWERWQFSDITTSRLGKMLDAKQQTGNCVFPYLANFNVQWFRIETDNLNEMDFNESEQEEFMLEEGDLLVCEGGEIGRCAVWHNQVQPCFFQKALHRVRCNQELILPDYLAWWFKYNCEHKGFASIEGAKATIAHLPGAKMKLLQVTVPSMELQEKFVTFMQQVDKSKFKIQKAIDESQLLFDSLMQKYFG